MWLQTVAVGSATKALLVGFIAVILALWYQWRKKHPALKRIPGPTGLPIVGNLFEFAFNGFDIIKTFRKLAKEHGGIYRFEAGDSAQSTLIILSKPEYLQTFYSSKVNLNRSVQYEPIAEAVGDSVFCASGTRWKKLRKMTMWDFFNAPADQLIKAFLDEIDPMIAEFRKHANGQLFPSKRILQKYTAQSMNVNSLGEPLSPEIADILANTSDEIMKIAYQRNFYIHYFSDLIFSLLPAGKRFYNDIAHTNQVIMKMIKRKKAELNDMKTRAISIPNTYIYKLIENDETDESLADEFKIMFISGADTSSTTMGFMLTCLGLYPEVQQRVLEEDKAIYDKLDGRPLTVDHLREYEYLERVMKETLRIFPIGPLIARVLSEDTDFGKYMLPKGTNVAALQIAANFDPTIFVEPTRFNPDRYLPENAKNIPQYAFNPFSGGPRSCPGQRYATMVIKINIASIIRNYKVTSGYKNIEDVWNSVDAEITLKDKNHYPIRLEPRV